MKTAITVILSGCALSAAAPPAFADKVSLQKGVRICEAELDRHAPGLVRHRVDYDDSTSNEAQFRLTFKGLDEQGKYARFTCTIDRETRAASVARVKPRQADDATFATREWRATP